MMNNMLQTDEAKTRHVISLQQLTVAVSPHTHVYLQKLYIQNVEHFWT